MPDRVQEESESIEELTEASESTLDDETDSSESGSKGKSTPDRVEVSHLLTGEALPEQDDKDADYQPDDGGFTGMKRKRVSAEDPDVGSKFGQS